MATDIKHILEKKKYVGTLTKRLKEINSLKKRDYILETIFENKVYEKNTLKLGLNDNTMNFINELNKTNPSLCGTILEYIVYYCVESERHTFKQFNVMYDYMNNLKDIVMFINSIKCDHCKTRDTDEIELCKIHSNDFTTNAGNNHFRKFSINGLHTLNIHKVLDMKCFNSNYSKKICNLVLCILLENSRRFAEYQGFDKIMDVVSRYDDAIIDDVRAMVCREFDTLDKVEMHHASTSPIATELDILYKDKIIEIKCVKDDRCVILQLLGQSFDIEPINELIIFNLFKNHKITYDSHEMSKSHVNEYIRILNNGTYPIAAPRSLFGSHESEIYFNDYVVETGFDKFIIN
jgi:hypothetical protein